MRQTAVLLIAFVVAALAGPALAAEPAGEAVAVDPKATGTLEGAVSGKPLLPGDGIFMGQTIVTADTGEVQIVFADNTRLVVGPKSSLVIDQYLMRNDGSLTKFVIDILGGTFRFLTGDSSKDVYEIDTPTTQIGVRGTAFDLTVEEETGTTKLLLYHGGVNLCGAGRCKAMTEACAVAVVPSRGAAKVVAHTDGRRTSLVAGFRYLKAQSTLENGFRVADAAACRQTRLDESIGITRPIAPDPQTPIR